MSIGKINNDIFSIVDDIYEIMEDENIKIRFENKDILIYGDALDGGKIERIDLFIKVDYVNLRDSDEKFHIFKFSDISSEFYDGEHLVIKSMNEAIDGQLNYKGVDLNIHFSLDDFENIFPLNDGYSLESYLDVLEVKNIKSLLRELEQQDSPNVVNSKEVRELFGKLGETQRGEPEIQMLHCQRLIGGGVYSHMLEHVGDLTHRMSESIFSSSGDLTSTIEYVSPKVKRCLSALTNEYGFLNEHKENLESNYSYYGKDKTFEEWQKNIERMLNEYSDKHSKLIVYNKPQYAAREAAVSLGRGSINEAIEHLKYLNDILDNGEYLKEASLYTKGGYEPKSKIKRSFKNKI